MSLFSNTKIKASMIYPFFPIFMLTLLKKVIHVQNLLKKEEKKLDFYYEKLPV